MATSVAGNGNPQRDPRYRFSEAVAGALGETIEAAFGQWRTWALWQRDFIVNGKPGIATDEFEAVLLGFSTVSDEPSRSESTMKQDYARLA